MILLAIVNQRPRILTLREMLQHYIAHRREVVLRRSRFRLRKARERAHILEGFLKALDLIDAIIATIRASGTVGEARDALVSRFQFSELQAQAILEMRLQRLTGMERQRIEEEHAEVISLIAELEAILGSEARLMEVVRDELAQLRAQYADPRRTRIVDAAGELSMHDLVAEEDQVVTLSHLGYIKRCRPDEWKTQRRGGMGKRGMATRQEDFVTSIFVANTHSMLLVFTDQGTVFPLMVYDVPEAARDAKGRAIVNLVPVPEGERVSAVVSLKNLDDTSLSLLFVSRQGLVKRTSIAEFRNLRQGGMRACGVAEGDALVLVRVVDSAEYHVILFSRGGKCIRFGLDEVPEYGRPARGNLGMQLADGDEVVDVVLAPADALPLDDAEDDEDDAPLEEEIEEVGELTGSTLLTVTELGFGSRTDFHAYRPQRRNGKGILSFKIGDATGSVVGAIEVWPDDQLMLVTDTGRVIRFAAASVPVRRSRAVKGVRLMRLEPGERIVDLDRLEEPEEADDGPAEEPTEK